MTQAPPVGNVVAVVGVHSALGRLLCERLERSDAIERVVGIDGPVDDVARPQLERLLSGVTQVVHLAPGRGPDLDGTGTTGVDVAGTRRLLSAMTTVGTDRMVVLSSAMVYGPWPSNPIPITEAEPVRPHPALAFAVQKAEVERLVSEWAAETPERSHCALRPTVTVSSANEDWLSRSLWTASGVASDSEPPAQFLHLDDLVDALLLVCRDRLTGTFNVAPDGWVSGERIRALAGRPARVELPQDLVQRVGALRWLTGTTTTPPEVIPYTLAPWVVANDRLRDAGWEPRFSNEEAYVSAAPAGPLAMLGSQRRQELALGAVGGAAALGAAALVAGASWIRRR